MIGPRRRAGWPARSAPGSRLGPAGAPDSSRGEPRPLCGGSRRRPPVLRRLLQQGTQRPAARPPPRQGGAGPASCLVGAVGARDYRGPLCIRRPGLRCLPTGPHRVDRNEDARAVWVSSLVRRGLNSVPSGPLVVENTTFEHVRCPFRCPVAKAPSFRYSNPVVGATGPAAGDIGRPRGGRVR